MIKTRQLITSNVNGDCFRACVCAILDIPNSNDLPNITETGGWSAMYKFLHQFGLDLLYTDQCWTNGYWIASVKSKNYSGGTTHAIVMNFTKVAFDPSNKKRYHAGYRLPREQRAGEHGYILIVKDASKLHLLKEYTDLANGTE